MSLIREYEIQINFSKNIINKDKPFEFVKNDNNTSKLNITIEDEIEQGQSIAIIFELGGDKVYELPLTIENNKTSFLIPNSILNCDVLKIYFKYIGKNEEVLSISDVLRAILNKVPTGEEPTLEEINAIEMLISKVNELNKETKKTGDYVKEQGEYAESVGKDLEEKRDSGYFRGERGEKGERGEAGSVKFTIVESLPEIGDKQAIYLVPSKEQKESNIYDEYIYTDNGWEQLGSTPIEVDLTDYVPNTRTVNGKALSSNITLSASDIGAIVFDDTYITNADTFYSVNGYSKTSTSTTNLPSVCTDNDRWGVIFFVAGNALSHTGTQMYFPIDGTYEGRIFYRSIVRGIPSTWLILPTKTSELTNDSGFLTSIPDTYATKTYVDEKIGDIDTLLTNLNTGGGVE